MEHAVSDHLIDRIDAFLECPSTDPHGDPIPKADGTVEATEGRRLSEWQVGRVFRLVRVIDQSPEFLRYRSDNRLVIGVTGDVATKSSEAGVVTVRMAGQETTLSNEVADKLLVTASAADKS